jgi:signal transduction histidine kinase
MQNDPMSPRLHRHTPWLAAWLVVAVIGSLLLGQFELHRLEDGFERDARLAYRLLNHRASQHDALLSTLSLLRNAGDPTRAEQRLTAVYPQIVSIQRRDATAAWPQAQLVAAEAESRKLGRAALTELAIAKGRYLLVMGADPTSYAVQIDIRGMVPWSEWPMAADASPVRVTLDYAGQVFVLQPGPAPINEAGGWHFGFTHALTSASQPFEVVLQRRVGWAELPWSQMAAWSLLVAILLLAARALLRLRTDGIRAHELLRLGQVARLNTLGELAAGMANDLAQPVAEMLTNSRIANRVLEEDPPDVLTAQLAVRDALTYAQRVSDVITRLRYVVSQPDKGSRIEDIDLFVMARRALHVLDPELRRRGIDAHIEQVGPAFSVQGDPGALEQIMHNLLLNAMQSLDQVQINDRRLVVRLSASDKHGHFIVYDTGPGMPTDVLPHVFEPFFTTREGGLGLGLSLSESMAHAMGGTLTAFNQTPHGAEFRLSLPLAAPH